jgi:CHASE3 domain sensor protein
MFERVKKWQIPPRRVVLWQTLAAVPLATLVLLGAFLSYQYHEQSIASRIGVDRAYDVLTSVNGLFTQVQDAEVAELNYVLTGDETALKPFLSAVSLAGPSAARSTALVADDAEQSKRMVTLEAGIAAKLHELGETVELRRTRGLDAAKEQMATDRAGEATDLLRAQALDIVRAEYRLLQRRQEANRAHEKSFLRIGIAMAGMSIATRLLVAWAVRRMSKRGQKTPFGS